MSLVVVVVAGLGVFALWIVAVVDAAVVVVVVEVAVVAAVVEAAAVDVAAFVRCCSSSV